VKASNRDFDALIIGGGFYGAAIAVYLAKRREFKNLLLVERESALMMRASYKNQARVHNGYHYPRSLVTAYRSRINMPNFVRDWPTTVQRDFTKLYAIARRNSKVTARQFDRFCRDIGASLERAPPELKSLFEARLIEEVFVAEEYAFDATKLAVWAEQELMEAGVTIRLKSRAIAICNAADHTLKVTLRGDDENEEQVLTRYVFNCAYSGLNQLHGDFSRTRTGLKHEITEMPLIQLPDALKGFGVTVMDGPFFSVMPFPALGLHTLSHVRYTPHLSWNDEADIDPYKKLEEYGCSSRFDRMLRDSGRYVPLILGSRYVKSLFEVKTVLVKSETDDGRPILFERHSECPGLYAILGGKIDNIFDVLEYLDNESLQLEPN
jgi:glycine/D-amino acid oxidase-like deaminating enzyme